MMTAEHPRAPQTLDPASLLSDEAFARRIAIGLLRDRAAADDLVQEAWLDILDRPPQHASNLRGYLAKILRRLSSRKRRDEERRAARERWSAEHGARQSDAAEVVARAEIHQRTVAAALALDEPYRATILLRFFDDLTPGEIAARERISVETVCTRLKRALAMLSARLEQEGRDWRAEWAIALTGGTWPGPVLAGPREGPSLARWGFLAAVTAVPLVLWLVRTGARPAGADSPRRSIETLTVAGESSTRAAFELAEDPGRTEPVTQAAPGAAAPAAALAGRVTDAEGHPLAGVRVNLMLERFDATPELSSVFSDDDGTFSCSLAGWTAMSPCARGAFSLAARAWKSGYAPRYHSLEPGPDGIPPPLSLVLVPDGSSWRACSILLALRPARSA